MWEKINDDDGSQCIQGPLFFIVIDVSICDLQVSKIEEILFLTYFILKRKFLQGLVYFNTSFKV